MSQFSHGRATIISLVSAYFRRTTSSALNTIVAPASNVAGVRVDAATIYGATGNGLVRIMAKSSAPTSVNDTGAHTLLMTYAELQIVDREVPIILPAGVGLYEQAEAAAGNSFVSVSYEVLA